MPSLVTCATVSANVFYGMACSFCAKVVLLLGFVSVPLSMFGFVSASPPRLRPLSLLKLDCCHCSSLALPRFLSLPFLSRLSSVTDFLSFFHFLLFTCRFSVSLEHRLYSSPRAKKSPGVVSPRDWLKSERAREELANVAEALTFALADDNDATAATSPLSRSLDSHHLRRLSREGLSLSPDRALSPISASSRQASDVSLGGTHISSTVGPAPGLSAGKAAALAARRRRSSVLTSGGGGGSAHSLTGGGGGSTHSLTGGGGNGHAHDSEAADRAERYVVPPQEDYVHVPDPNRVRRGQQHDEDRSGDEPADRARGGGHHRVLPKPGHARSRILPKPGAAAQPPLRQTLYVNPLRNSHWVRKGPFETPMGQGGHWVRVGSRLWIDGGSVE